mgnify:CR=1 FL=1
MHDDVLTQLQMYDFALQEAALFLNSHPHDKEALSYYRTMQCCSKQAREEYEALQPVETIVMWQTPQWLKIHKEVALPPTMPGMPARIS